MEQWPVFSWPCCSADCHLVWLPSPTRAQGSLLFSTNRQGSAIRLLTVTGVKKGGKDTAVQRNPMKAERCCTLQLLRHEFSGVWFLTEIQNTSPYFGIENKGLKHDCEERQKTDAQTGEKWKRRGSFFDCIIVARPDPVSLFNIVISTSSINKKTFFPIKCTIQAAISIYVRNTWTVFLRQRRCHMCPTCMFIQTKHTTFI